MEYIANIIYIPFSGVGWADFKGQKWLDYRIKLFKEYTLKSLQIQEAQSFMIWLSFRPEEKGNYSVQQLELYIQKLGIKAVFTYDGLMYWDDKFQAGLIETCKNILRVVRQCWREKNLSGLWRIRNVLNNKNKTLHQRLENSLAVLRTEIPEPTSWVYLTRIDSDDMFRRDLIKNIQKIPPFRGAITCSTGYVYNSFTGEMAEWNPPTNPPFHTIIFPGPDFFDARYYLQYMRTFKSHEDIPKVFTCLPAPERSYCVLIHGNHISTIWDHPFRGKLVNPKILEDFTLPEYREYEKGLIRRFDGHDFAIFRTENRALDEILQDFMLHKDYEPETTKIVKSVVKSDDVAVDAGASIGYFTLLLARQAKEVYSFEPTTNQFPVLEENVRLNGYQNVKLFNTALAEETKKIRINANADFQGVDVDAVALDDVLPEKVDFIKMDIDGSEPQALKGLIKTIERNPQLKMIIECYPEYIKRLGHNPEDMLAILDKYFNYRRVQGEFDDMHYNLYCERK